MAFKEFNDHRQVSRSFGDFSFKTAAGKPEEQKLLPPKPKPMMYSEELPAESQIQTQMCSDLCQ